MASYQQLARQAAKKYGIPPGLFAALVKQESGWNPNAASPAGAVGLVQIHLPSHPDVTAEQARDPRFALDWGARYLAAQRERFGNWRQALAAYNAGPGRVEDGSWKDIPETANYVRSILAAAGKVKSPQVSLAPASATTTPLNGLDGLASQVFQSNAQIAAGQPLQPTDVLAGLVGSLASAPPPTMSDGGSVPLLSPAPSGAQSFKGLVLPLGTKLPGGSEYALPDPEGAPSKTGQRYHAALDWFAPAGAAVRAPVTGKVVEVKPSRGNTGQVFGGVVKIQAPNGRVFVFRHVDPAKLKVGQRVRAGTPVAGVSAWRDGSPHAHIEVWKTLRGGYSFENMLDPAEVFGG